MASSDKEAYEFVMSFIAASERYRDQFVDKWQTVISNFIVEPDLLTSKSSESPYRRTGHVYSSSRNRIVLKDPETHKLVMTYASKLARALFGESHREYVRASPSGYEDDIKAQTTTRLLRYAFSLPGMFRTFVESLIDMLLFGTSVVEVGYSYIEREMLVRSVSVDEFGLETSTSTRLPVPVYDDVIIRPIDVTKFYPDPSRYRIQDMSGAAKQFQMNGVEARRMGQSQIYDARAVERAIDYGATSRTEGHEPNFREGLDQPKMESVSGFDEMIGYEYWGEVPMSKGGYSRRVVTVLNSIVVRNDPFPFADPQLPFHCFTINPVQGRFYGISPAEVVRFDQSLADAIKILLAEAIIRQVHPPIAYDHNADADLAALKAWKSDALVGVNGGPNAIGTIKYDANIAGGFGMLQGLKMSIQEGSGALGAIQGEEGPDRESATVGANRIQMAMDRPEMAALLLENDTLPGIGSAILRRYQQFLLDTDDLKKRIGEQPEPMWIGNVMGDFDVQFFGSRMGASRQQKLQAFDRLVAYAQAIPAFQAILPNEEIARYVLHELLEIPDIAGMIANPQDVMRNLAAMQAFGAGGSGQNQLPTSSEPPGILPQQASGGVP